MSLSRFLKMPDGTFSPWILHLEVEMYVITEFHEKLDPKTPCPPGTDSEKIVQVLIDHSSHKFRMYGSAQEVLENVRIASNFPESHKFLNCMEGPFTRPPIIFESLRQEGKFICKSDLFVILQNMALAEFETNTLGIVYLLSLHLKSQEEKINKGRFEFVRFDERLLAELESDFKLGLAKNVPINAEVLNAYEGNITPTIDEWLGHIKSLSPDAWTSGRTHPNTSLILRRFYEGLAVDRAERLKISYELTRSLTRALQYVIEKHPELFLPHRTTMLADNRHPITVRVFEDGDQRFMLRQEISSALIRNESMLSSESMVFKDEANVLHTIDIDDVLGCYDTTDIEFIRYPIRRSKHRTVPVKVSTTNGPRFFVLAIDALFEFLREVIFTLRMFQNPNNIIQMLDCLYYFFIPDCTRPYFMSYEGLALLENTWTEFEKAIGSFSPMQVRNAKKDGFTMQNLKNELAHLGLLNAFPDIQNHVDLVYSEVDKRKKEKVLRTCDLFDAIEHCQLLCIFNRLPTLKKFLHNQKSCRRVIGMKCSTCPPFYQNDLPTKPQKMSESKTPIPKSISADTESKKIPDSQNLKTTSSESKQPNQTASEAAKASQEKQTTTSAEASSTSEDRVPAQRTSKPTSSRTSSDPQKPPDSPTQKTSANCEKCFRACEMLNETKKELKSSESKLKNVEKKMLGKEREMVEFKKNQKGKMDEKEKEIQMRTEEIQGLKKRVQEKEDENRSLKDKIFKQESSRTQVEEERFRQEEQLEMTRKHLEERVSRLEQELREGNENMWELQNQMASDQAQFEAEILEKNREIEKLKEAEIRMKAENEVNQRMIQKLMDKLASSGFRKSCEVSTTSSSRIQKCEICWNETNDREAVRCQKCRRPFHQKCSSQWLKSYKNCPSCNEEFLESTNTHFSTFS